MGETKHKVERDITRRGDVPVSVWMAYPHEGRYWVILVGHYSVIEATHKLLGKPKNFLRSIFLPIARLEVRGKAPGEDPVTLPLGVLVLGSWGTYDEAKGIVKQISQTPDDGADEWAPRLRNVFKHNRRHIAKSTHAFSQDTLQDLVNLFLGECRWSMESE
jgi:hypothetical protein